jgi:glycerol kinase
MILSAAVDLGSTRFKAAVLDEAGTLHDMKRVPAPPLTGSGLIREGDGPSYLNAATNLLKDLLSGLPKEVPIGLASQRSTFLLWDKETGTPVTPLVSWQDRRADDWCKAKEDTAAGLVQSTGLLLSPHYAAPKLSYLFSMDRNLRDLAKSGSLLFGTLETYLLWNWTSKGIHETDLSMSARTLLVDPRTGEWSDPLLRFFGIPRSLLPAIASTWGRTIPLDWGGLISATITDQAASVLAVMDDSSDLLIINLGTGGFVITPTGSEMKEIPGYLSGPLARAPNGSKEFALEGTINGIAPPLADLQDETVTLTDTDPLPNHFCLPDTTGIGAPHWLADMGSLFSEPPGNLTPSDRKRVIMEGIIFRIVEIVRDLCGKEVLSNILLSGGLSHETFIQLGLSSCLGQPIQIVKEKETTLLGAARLAAPKREWPSPDFTRVHPGAKGHYLQEKFLRWREWLQQEIRLHRRALS